MHTQEEYLGGPNPQRINSESYDERLEALLLKMARADSAVRRDALGELYSHTASRIYGLVLSIIRDHGKAESVTQDVFVRVYEAACKYSPQGKPLAWMFTIARNFALMALRRKDNNLDALPTEIDGGGADGGFGAGGGNASYGNPSYGSGGACEASHEDELLDTLTLQAVLSQLGEDDRQIVIMHSVGGMKHREISALMDLPVATVLSKYNRSLKKLKTYLGG
jgi:RNA polymerase sigma-70 factor (ECF subfamily)